MSTDLIQVPNVHTLAKPEAADLLKARHAVGLRRDLHEAFLAFQGQPYSEETAQKLAESIEPILLKEFERNPASVPMTARYLADEYLQIGDTILIIDPKTGKAIAKITDEDFWTPSPVPREDGTMAHSTPRLRPDLQGALVRWRFDTEREKETLSSLSEKVLFTPLDYEKSDSNPKLLPTTRTGREELVQQLNDFTPSDIIQSLSGTTRMFLDAWREGEPSNVFAFQPFLGLEAISCSTFGLQDLRARNLSFSVRTSSKVTIATSWARAIAKQLLEMTLSTPSTEVDFSQIEADPTSLWLTEAHGAWHLQLKGQKAFSTGESTDSGKALRFLSHKCLGYVAFRRYVVDSREIHDRWEILGRLTYDLYVDPSVLTPLRIMNLPPQQHQALIAP